MAKNEDIDDPELEAVKQLTRIADALEDLRDVLDAATAPCTAGGGRSVDVRVIES